MSQPILDIREHVRIRSEELEVEFGDLLLADVRLAGRDFGDSMAQGDVHCQTFRANSLA